MTNPSPFVTVPQPMANIGTIIASVQALMHNMNLLIVNSQSTPQGPNLSGADIFSKVTQLQIQVTNLANEVADIEKVLKKNGIV